MQVMARLQESVKKSVRSKVRGVRSGAKTRKSAATRQRIMKAAEELIEERGGVDFQMSEVSERCKLSKGSLYYYFSDRDALAQAIFSKAADEFVEAAERLVVQAPTALDAIVSIANEFSSRISVNAPLASALLRGSYSSGEDVGEAMTISQERVQRVVGILTDQVERAKREGTVRDDVDSGLVSVSLVGAFLMSAYELIGFGQESLGPEHERGRLLAMLIRGIGTEKGCALLAQRRD